MTSPMAVDVTLMRGGTSKGVFVRLQDLPNVGAERDSFARRLLGSPDPMQLDGLGGTHSSTSKLMAVGTPSDAASLGYETPDGVELCYLFAQVGVDSTSVDWRGNCGNLTTAVAPYALHEGMIKASGRTADVSLLNLNVNGQVTVHFPVRDGELDSDGDFRLDGVPGTGARIDVDYLAPAGSVTGALLPMGSLTSRIQVGDDDLEVTMIDVGTPVVIIRAEELGFDMTRTRAELNTDERLLNRLEQIRAHVAEKSGIVGRAADAWVQSPAVPRVVIATVASDTTGSADGPNITVRMTSMGVIHHALPGTGLMAIAAAMRIPGTVLTPDGQVFDREVSVGHPKGIAIATADVEDSAEGPVVRNVGLPRTARRVLKGTAFLAPEQRHGLADHDDHGDDTPARQLKESQ